MNRSGMSNRWPVIAAALCALLSAACASPQPEPSAESADADGSLAGTSWRLVEFVSSDDEIGTVTPENPAAYTMSLEADGRASLQLDCNRGSGPWTATPSGDEGGTFNLGPLALTRAFCGPESLDTQIARDAEYMRTYLLRDGRLHINLMADGGTYTWERIEA